MRRGVASASVIALDAPRRAGPGEGLSWVLGGVLVAALLIVGLFFGDDVLGDADGLFTALTVGIATAGAGTAYLVYSHAASSRNRAYLALASTYAAVAWTATGLLFLAPGALVTGEQLLGGPQSAAWASVFLHLVLPVGIGVTGAILWNDGRSYRRPGPDSHVMISLAMSAAVLTVVAIVVTVGADALPRLVDADGSPAGAWMATWTVVCVLSLAAVSVVIAMGSARYSMVAGWMIGAAGLSLAASVVNLGEPQLFSVSWLVTQLLCVSAVILIPAMMLIQLGQVERTATRVADEDPLTGLTSRGGLLGRLDYEIDRAEALSGLGALLWVDLDGFKAVNDQFGHAGGDEALRQVASRLRHAARPTDTVARVSGDEFGMLMVDLGDPGDARAIAGRALVALRDPVSLESASPLLTASIGVVHFPSHGNDADELLHRADLAMYAAKNEGGDQVAVYDEPMARTAAKQATARQRLARGLRDDTFELHYQPVIDLRTGSTVGVEALVRWKRDGALVAAGEFIPLAESTGQIRSVGRVVLELLAHDLRNTGPLPEGFRVAVNLSVPELADPATADRLCDGELADYLDHLTIEVTEGVMLADHAPAIENLSRVRSSGAVIALDDFGSGFANVEALAGLNPDLVKVDSAFTRRAGRGETSGLAFLRAAHAIGSAIGAQVLAEGIETEDELRTVTGLGIELGQGFYLGRPVDELVH